MNNDFLTIGQITDKVDITRQGVYFYESLNLIKPIALANKIRLYSPDTIDKIKKIKELSKTYKLEAIANMIKEGKL